MELRASYMLGQYTVPAEPYPRPRELLFGLPAALEGLSSGDTKLMYFSRKITKCLEISHTPDELLGQAFPQAAVVATAVFVSVCVCSLTEHLIF